MLNQSIHDALVLSSRLLQTEPGVQAIKGGESIMPL